MSSITAFLHDLAPGDVPAAVRERARLWLLDLAGVAAVGARTPLSRIVRDHAASQFGAGTRGAARMLMDGRPVGPAGAALAGGMTIDAMDAHDGHRLTKGHAGCGVLPALLALAEAEGRMDGAEFLCGLVLGYEIGTRAGIALHRTARDYHTSGAWVSVACAGLGSRLLGLDAGATRHALGIAEYHGPRSPMMRCIDHPTMLKDGSGWGAMAGVSACYLAADGFTGAPALTVEGADVADLWGDLGSRWHTPEQYWKAYPVCRWAQPAVEGVLSLRAAHDLRPEDVERIEVATFDASLRLAVRAPRTTEEAQYSTSYPAAAAMVRGRVGPAEVGPAAFADPEIGRLSGGMVLRAHAGHDAAFPARRFADVTLVLRDGRRLEVRDVEARGDPEAPATEGEIRGKFRDYAALALPPARVGRIEAAVGGLETDGLRPLLDALCAPLDQRCGETGGAAIGGGHPRGAPPW
ncbi:MmgE/PrpD family protein [Jannaschia sp. LMIT008]|uniref:MmgE/PrpD family protein n=1 Tax=Jannaschia maritima TaxID=3032585 RepID=UPI0028113959|nr:MmgE/PrpD family protein [Jannaschia sp. LMIT008]